MPGFPPSDALAVKKCLGVNAAPLVQRDPPQLQGPVTVNPALSSRNMPIHSRYPHFAVHHDRPISVSSLDRRRGREKLSRKERRSSYEEGGCMTSDITLSARPRASGRLVDWHIPGLSRRPASQLPILQLARSNWRILSRSSKEMLLAEPS